MDVGSETHQPEQGSHLFMLRLWPEDIGDGQIDWRGSVQHVNSGEVRYFRDWATLRAFVEGLLGRMVPTGEPVGEGEKPDLGAPQTRRVAGIASSSAMCDDSGAGETAPSEAEPRR